MKVIFLDVDGVIRHDFYKVTKDDNGIDGAKLELLKEIIEKTEAKIVLSSTWRRMYDENGNTYNDELYNILEKNLKSHELEIHSEIPRSLQKKKINPISMSIEELIQHESEDNDRAEFIVMWLDNHPEVESFVIIDDFGGWKKHNLEDYLVKTSSHTGGLLPEHVEKAIDILNKPKVRKR